MYEALKASSNKKFNNQIIVWRSVHGQTETLLDVDELLDKAKVEYRGMAHLDTWRSKNKIELTIPR